MFLIQLTVAVHLVLHGLLWALIVTAIVGLPLPQIVHWAEIWLPLLILLHLNAYHWSISQWENLRQPAVNSVVNALFLFIAALWPVAEPYLILLICLNLFASEHRGLIKEYIQPWYLRLRWLMLGSLSLHALVQIF